MREIKKNFPIFQSNPDLVYFDSAATTQTPGAVIEATNNYYTKFRANVHRGLYNLSVQATEQYEGGRAELTKFINADPDEIIFTAGATAGLNQLAYYLSPRLSHRDNVVLTRLEHHANLVPWQVMAKHYGFALRFIEVTDDFALDLDSAKKLIDENTKIVSVCLASNVLGTVNPVEEIIKLARQKALKCYAIADAAQAAPHRPIDVKKLDCDWLVLSGHKMYGPTGTGVLYGKKILLEEHLEPFFYGGDMVREVSYQDAILADVPQKFEAGTPNIAGAIGLGAAVRFIRKIGWETIQNRERKLTKKLLDGLISLGATIIGPAAIVAPGEPIAAGNRIGVVSFVLPGVHPHDAAEFLGQEGICVRAGFHCAEPLHRHLGLNAGTVRASIGLYTTSEDIEKLINGIMKTKEMLK